MKVVAVYVEVWLCAMDILLNDDMLHDVYTYNVWMNWYHEIALWMSQHVYDWYYDWMHDAYEYMWMQCVMICICVMKMLGEPSPCGIGISKRLWK